MLCPANVPKGGESDTMSSIHNKCSTYQLIHLPKVLNSKLIVCQKHTLVYMFYECVEKIGAVQVIGFGSIDMSEYVSVISEC